VGSAVDFVETRRLISRRILADVRCPGGFVLGWGVHADSGVRPDGARTSEPTRR